MAQMTLFDYGVTDPPEVWECMKTCARSDIYTDTFPLGGKRCLYGLKQDGTSGKDMYQRVVDNKVTFYCRYYKREEGEDDD